MDTSVEKHTTSYLIKVTLLATAVIAALGYIDFITGEISLDILYIFCLCVVTWYTNTFVGILCVLELICAKTTADYYDKVKIGSHLYEWNTFNYIFIYLIICLLIGKVRQLLTR